MILDNKIYFSYIKEQKGELWLSNCFIKKYNNALDKNYDPLRDRKLLISKKEFNKIVGSVKKEGFSIIPITLYFTYKGLAKLSFGVGKGKKKFDKRYAIKSKEWDRKKQRLEKNKQI